MNAGVLGQHIRPLRRLTRGVFELKLQTELGGWTIDSHDDQRGTFGIDAKAPARQVGKKLIGPHDVKSMPGAEDVLERDKLGGSKPEPPCVSLT